MESRFFQTFFRGGNQRNSHMHFTNIPTARLSGLCRQEFTFPGNVEIRVLRAKIKCTEFFPPLFISIIFLFLAVLSKNRNDRDEKHPKKLGALYFGSQGSTFDVARETELLVTKSTQSCSMDICNMHVRISLISPSKKRWKKRVSISHFCLKSRGGGKYEIHTLIK